MEVELEETAWEVTEDLEGLVALPIHGQKLITPTATITMEIDRPILTLELISVQEVWTVLTV